MTLYLAAAVLLLALGVVTIFTVGLYLIFLALAMLSVVWAHGRRPWIIEGTIVGAFAAVVAHILTAPGGCTVSETSGANPVQRAVCQRIVLPDVHSLDTGGAHALSLVIAVVVGITAGMVVARIARRQQSERVG